MIRNIVVAINVITIIFLFTEKGLIFVHSGRIELISCWAFAFGSAAYSLFDIAKKYFSPTNHADDKKDFR